MALQNDSIWYTAPKTSDGFCAGRDATAKIGFEGTTPVARSTISISTGTLPQVITALGALGIIITTA